MVTWRWTNIGHLLTGSGLWPPCTSNHSQARRRRPTCQFCWWRREGSRCWSHDQRRRLVVYVGTLWCATAACHRSSSVPSTSFSAPARQSSRPSSPTDVLAIAPCGPSCPPALSPGDAVDLPPPSSTHNDQFSSRRLSPTATQCTQTAAAQKASYPKPDQAVEEVKLICSIESYLTLSAPWRDRRTSNPGSWGWNHN